MIFECTNGDGNDATNLIKYAFTDFLKLCPACYQSLQIAASNDPEAYGPVEAITLLPTPEELA